MNELCLTRFEKTKMAYFLHIVILVEIYAMLAMSLNLISGFAGLVSLAHAAFYGVGAYVAGLLAIKYHCSFILSLGCGVALCALLGLVVSAPSLRVKDDYFVIASFAFQIIAFSVLNNWTGATGGAMGLPGIPPLAIGGWVISSPAGYCLLLLGFVILAFWGITRVARSPFGRVLLAIREDELLAETYGKSVTSAKVLVFVVGGGVASMAGAMYAHYMAFIDPSSFTVMESIFMISIVIIGGAGSLWGPILGAVVLVCLPEALRLVGMPSSVGANVRQMLYGAALAGLMVWRPQGMIGKYTFSREDGRG
jgi:branched-chain amino acid transport system permease protein